MRDLIQSIVNDDMLKALLLLVVVDFALGVIVALKNGIFRLSYIADFGRNDIAFKVVPYAVLLAASTYAGHDDLVIPGLDFNLFAKGAGALFIAALVGSILNSARDLGIGLPQSIAGEDPNARAIPIEVDRDDDRRV